MEPKLAQVVIFQTIHLQNPLVLVLELLER